MRTMFRRSGSERDAKEDGPSRLAPVVLNQEPSSHLEAEISRTKDKFCVIACIERNSHFLFKVSPVIHNDK